MTYPWTPDTKRRNPQPTVNNVPKSIPTTTKGPAATTPAG
jgi:hypothetical protein